MYINKKMHKCKICIILIMIYIYIFYINKKPHLTDHFTNNYSADFGDYYPTPHIIKNSDKPEFRERVTESQLFETVDSANLEDYQYKELIENSMITHQIRTNRDCENSIEKTHRLTYGGSIPMPY